MSHQPTGQWETHLRQMLDEFSYPPTPDIAGAVRRRLEQREARPVLLRRQLAWGVVIALVVLAGLMAVPQVRAAVFEILRIGAIRIVPVASTPTATPTVPALAPTGTLPTITPTPAPTPLSSVLDLAGETTLLQARAKAGFPIRLPTSLPDLPDHVFLQDFGGPVVVLVWMDRTQPNRVRLSLHELGPGTFAEKIQPPIVQETTVNGQRAVWTEGPHLLQFLRNGQPIYDARRLVEGHTLVWTQGEITYRLETGLSLSQAVRIAESLSN